MNSDEMWEGMTKTFIQVRDSLLHDEHTYAYRMAYKQPWKFYRENTATEAILILIEKYGLE